MKSEKMRMSSLPLWFARQNVFMVCPAKCIYWFARQNVLWFARQNVFTGLPGKMYLFRPKLLRALIIPSPRRRRAGSLGNAPDFIAITRKLKWGRGGREKLSGFLYSFAGKLN
jgi:hypothetical protein